MCIAMCNSKIFTMTVNDLNIPNSAGTSLSPVTLIASMDLLIESFRKGTSARKSQIHSFKIQF